MTKDSAIVKQFTLSMLKMLLKQQETNLRNLENALFRLLEEQQDTRDKIEVLEAELEAHEIVTQ
jgi:septal ring factor EnvC (AmiA/AmiB activator)